MRSASAAIRRTYESEIPSKPASAALLKSISGAIRFRPRTTRTFRSASAWNLIRKAGSLEFCNQIGVLDLGALVCQLRSLFSLLHISIDHRPVRELEGQGAIHLFQRNNRVTFNHAFRRVTFAKQIHQGV